MNKLVMIGLAMVLISCSPKEVQKEDKLKNMEIELQSIIEQAYFEGQRDALNSDIRIKKEGGKWIWIKSPWDDGLEPVFDPSK